jgi:hypothetical protein
MGHLVFSRVQRPSAVLATGMIAEGVDCARICARWFIVSLGPFCYMAQFLLVGHCGDSVFEGDSTSLIGEDAAMNRRLDGHFEA